MKERILSAIKKIAVILIASLMILGVVPIGMITMRPHTARAEGEFLRLAPSAETTVTSAVQERTSAKGMLRVGGREESYLRFDLHSLIDNKDLAEVKEATLRLTALKTETEPVQPVRLWLMSSANWDNNMKWRDRPSKLGEVKLMDLMADTKGTEARVIEVDLTAYLKKWVEDETQQISLHLDAGADGVAGAFAGTGHHDPLWRPCLKVVTGEAMDPDSEDLTKAWLDKTARTGGGSGNFYAGRGKETYLKFNLKPENIRGAMYTARLRLTMQTMDAAAELSIYQLKNGQWTEEQYLPQGKEVLIYHGNDLSARTLRNIDLTDVVNDAYAKGETSVTLKITGSLEGEVSFAAEGESRPALEIQVSDAAEMVALTQAAVYALNDHQADAVQGNLKESYTTEHGARAEIRWSAEEDVLEPNGTIHRPQWFEDSRTIGATASITSGEYTRERAYTLTVLPEETPDFSGWELGDYLNLGASGDEEDHGFGERNTAANGRWIGTRYFPYRRMEEGGMMAINLTVHPEERNYLTVKVWKENRPTSALQIENLLDREMEPIFCQLPAELTEEDGFLYLTYPLPLEMTQGRTYVSLRLRCGEETAQSEEEIVRWDIYGAYTTQTPYFDPLAFAKQGETYAGKKTAGVSVFRRLLNRMYQAAKQPWEDFTERWANEDAVLPAQTEEEQEEKLAEEPLIWLETEPPMFAFEDEGDRIAISVEQEGRRVKIHRSHASYDTYAETEWKTYWEDMAAIDYGKYRVFRNQTSRERRIPWQEETLTGIYQDLVSEAYWAFLQEGEMADDSVLPPEAELKDGKTLKVDRLTTMVLKQLAEPLKTPQWRISAINGTSVSKVRLNRGLELSRVTVKNTGQKMEEAEKLKVLCCSYEKGMLAGITYQIVTVIPGRGEYQVNLPPMTVTPGQTLKIFVEPTSQKPQAIIPKFELR